MCVDPANRCFRKGEGALTFLCQPTVRFYGFEENAREVEMDMREMVDKVKRGEPLYGKSSLSPYMQGVASRNSRYAGVFYHVIPWYNFVNHDQVCAGPGLYPKHAHQRQHGVDTAKYYLQAEKELEEERLKRGGS
jgi:hypothetical protein